MHTAQLLTATAAAALLLSAPLHAQDVEVGPGGTRVKAGGVEVQTGEEGTQVQAGGVRVDVRGDPAGTKAAPRRPKRRLPKRGAVVCRGTKDVVVRGKAIAGEVGVEVRGACNIVLERCDVTARKVGVRVSGQGDVTLRDSTVTAPTAVEVAGVGNVILENSAVRGRTAAVLVTGAGDVSAEGSEIHGRVTVTGAGDFHDKGGNTLTE